MFCSASATLATPTRKPTKTPVANGSSRTPPRPFTSPTLPAVVLLASSRRTAFT